jgi:uncharacterized repeat protein (TIGR01451 family)/LPXTG-motif cell wall-anchored protein
MRLLHRRIWFRFGAGAAAAVAAASVVALSDPAHAGAGGADLAVSIPSTTIVRDAGKPFAINVHNNGPEAATGIKLIIDASKLDTNKLQVFPPNEADGCDVDATTKVVTCPVPELPPGGNYNGFNPTLPRAVLVRALDVAGEAGGFTVSVTSDTPDPDRANNTATTDVTVATGGIDVVAWAQDVYANPDGTEGLQPGQTGQLLWVLWNQGNKTVKGVEYTIVLPPYLTFLPKPGCTYESADTVAHCVVEDVQIDPGGAFAESLLDPTLVTLAGSAPGPVALTAGIVSGHGLAEVDPAQAQAMRSPAASQRAGVLSAAEATKLKNSARSRAATVPGGDDADPNDNEAQFSVFTAGNPADLSVSATPVSGHIGDTANLTMTVKNAGPADVLEARVKVTAPTGTEIVSADAVCTATTPGKEYTCELGSLPAGESSASGAFKLRIVTATVTDGKVEVSSVARDPNPGDNTAPIKVTVLDDSGAPSAEPSAPGTEPSAPGTDPSAPAVGGTAGGLPVTGAQAGPLSALGLGVAAVGGGLMVLARRRRAVVVPPTD